MAGALKLGGPGSLLWERRRMPLPARSCCPLHLDRPLHPVPTHLTAVHSALWCTAMATRGPLNTGLPSGASSAGRGGCAGRDKGRVTGWGEWDGHSGPHPANPASARHIRPPTPRPPGAPVLPQKSAQSAGHWLYMSRACAEWQKRTASTADPKDSRYAPCGAGGVDGGQQV